MTEQLAGKIALITGASRGIGQAITEALHLHGATVVPVARPSDDFDALCERLGGRCIPYKGDATSNDLLDYIDAMERLDILINNVGTNVPKPMKAVDDATLDLMLDLNVRTTYRLSRHGTGRMSQGGRVVNITSQMGHVGSANRTVYCMTKHAIEGLTKAMAVELAPQGIRVNSVAPTFVETPMTAPMLADPDFSDFVQRMIPLGHVANTMDVARAVLYLCGEGGNMITGHSLLVDGGWTAQ
ncbi:SDR family NAD(P)-dependent oxidoreductase [Hyphomonas sp.]|uniref:SDR family NAD(P)-dependent oxidoreductase n=1 Tax=Hyphomonas sp. TaxID=87 RepID=UPI003567DCDD